MIGPAFERGLAGRELPARDAFLQHELEERARDDRPQQHDAVARAADGGRHDIAGADAGGGHDQAGAGKFENAHGRTRGVGHGHDYVP